MSEQTSEQELRNAARELQEAEITIDEFMQLINKAVLDARIDEVGLLEDDTAVKGLLQNETVHRWALERSVELTAQRDNLKTKEVK